MKIQPFLCRISIFIFLSCTGARLGAQESQTLFQATPVVPSKTVDTILGKAYRVHTVQKGHTLYSICRTYQVAADSILKDSPQNQVDIEELIYIPLHLLPGEREQDFSRFAGKRPWAVVFLKKDEVAQMVPPVETKAAIPTAESTVPENISDSTADPEISEETSPEKEKTRKRRERKNEHMSAADTLLVADTLAFLPDSVLLSPHPQAKPHKDSLRISLLLPLYSNTPQDKKAYIYLPFFEGATVAWQEFLDPSFFIPPVSDSITIQDSMTMLSPSKPDSDTSHVHLQLKVYDLTQSANSLDEIVNDSLFRLSDAVIATAFVDQFKILDSLSKEWQMPLIHPISERDSMGAGNPYFIQLAASYSTQINHIAGFIQKHHARARVIIISDSTAAETRKAEYLQELLPESERYHFNASTVEILNGLSEDNKKTVIVPFYHQEITAVKTVLPLRQTKGNVTIIAPNVWLDYPSVDLDYYIQNNLTVYHTFCNTARNAGLMEFSRKYYFLYHALPNPLAYRGYKTMLWLLDKLKAHNTDFMLYPETESEEEGVQDEETEVSYNLQERSIGGFENRDVHFVRITGNGLEHYKSN